MFKKIIKGISKELKKRGSSSGRRYRRYGSSSSKRRGYRGYRGSSSDRRGRNPYYGSGRYKNKRHYSSS